MEWGGGRLFQSVGAAAAKARPPLVRSLGVKGVNSLNAKLEKPEKIHKSLCARPEKPENYQLHNLKLLNQLAMRAAHHSSKR